MGIESSDPVFAAEAIFPCAEAETETAFSSAASGQETASRSTYASELGVISGKILMLEDRSIWRGAVEQPSMLLLQELSNITTMREYFCVNVCKN